MTLRPTSVRLLILLLAAVGARAHAGEAVVPVREANYTGTLLSSGPPLPQGALIVQPYLVQTQVTGRYDIDGRRHDVDGVADDWRVLLPMTYGVTDRFTIGATLRGIHARTDQAERRWAMGDTGLFGQYNLYKGTGVARPTLAVGVRQNMPTGRHDQLDRRGLADATGSGAAFTMLGVYGQAYFLPERNLRARVNLHYRVPGAGVTVNDRSGYGTVAGQKGRVHLGSAFQALAGAEYSFNPKWVLAADVLYERAQGDTLHRRTDTPSGVYREDVQGESSWRLSVAPAVEYHPSSKVGIIGGALVSVDGRNSAELFSPQLSVMFAF
jgi:long-subunit fatty acid transport protein